jgi:glycosyltransferase involved in cell wall biosynthesis
MSRAIKVLFSNNLPFFLAHGGTQTLIEALMRELTALGVEVEPERWWDQNQTGDVLHFMCRPPAFNVRAAQQKGFKVVMTESLDQTASRTSTQLFAQRCLTRLAQKVLPNGLTNRLNWEVYHQLDAMVYIVEHEWQAAQYLFGATARRGHVIPHGMDLQDLQQLAQPQPEQDYLISVATIHPRKNTLLLAQAARLSGIPIVFLGKPYAPDDPYFLDFQKLVDGRIVRYPGFVSTGQKHQYLRGARGFALLSQFESGCIALYEAAAAGLPLFLCDLPWAAKVYRHARGSRFVRLGSAKTVAAALSAFYAQAHRQPGTTFPILTWRQVAQKYLAIYKNLLAID